MVEFKAIYVGFAGLLTWFEIFIFELIEKMTMDFNKDVLKNGKGTEMILDSIGFNKKLPAHIFSKASLGK
jgi:hypothetical protein